MQEVLGADPLVAGALLQLLLPRLAHYYAPDAASPPLSLDKCAAVQVGGTTGHPFSARHLHSILQPVDLSHTALHACMLATSALATVTV